MNFVSFGRKNACDAIREEVELEFAAEWNASSLWRRWFLQRRIDAEVRRRAEKRAPRRGLY